MTKKQERRARGPLNHDEATHTPLVVCGGHGVTLYSEGSFDRRKLREAGFDIIGQNPMNMRAIEGARTSHRDEAIQVALLLFGHGATLRVRGSAVDRYLFLNAGFDVIDDNLSTRIMREAISEIKITFTGRRANPERGR